MPSTMNTHQTTHSTKVNKSTASTPTLVNEIYRMLGWAGQSGGPGTATTVLADGVLCYYNYYDNSIYAVGKGPSAVTVEAPLTGVAVDQTMIIQGMVTDESAGAKAQVASGEFNIVPAMSDASQAAWMEYIYMQQALSSKRNWCSSKTYRN